MKTIGCLPYLNVKPLSYLLEREPLPDGWSLKYAPPAQLAGMLRTGEICAAPVSSFALFDNPDLRIVPGICIASHGSVTSVLMFSNSHLMQDIRTIGADSGSLSGAALLKIILAERYGVSPQFVSHEPDIDDMLSRFDAALLLGNRAMIAAARVKSGVHVFDLGEEWRELTSLPTVFAVWAVTPYAPLDILLPLLERSKAAGLAALDDIVEEEAPKLDLPCEVCLDYLKNIMVYDLGDEEIKSLQVFADKAYEHGLLKRRAELRFANPVLVDREV